MRSNPYAMAVLHEDPEDHADRMMGDQPHVPEQQHYQEQRPHVVTETPLETLDLSFTTQNPLMRSLLPVTHRRSRTSFSLYHTFQNPAGSYVNDPQREYDAHEQQRGYDADARQQPANDYRQTAQNDDPNSYAYGQVDYDFY